MKECRVPENGPSKPSTRNRRMSSLRLQGVHRFLHRLPIEINSADYGQRMAELDSQKDPVFQRGAEFVLTFDESGPKCNQGEWRGLSMLSSDGAYDSFASDCPCSGTATRWT